MSLSALLIVVSLVATAILGYLFGLYRVILCVLGIAVIGSLAIDYPQIFVAKDVRTILTVVVFLVAAWHLLRGPVVFSPLIVIILAFLSFFLLSATWSETPYTALAYKGLFTLMALAGVFQGWAQTTNDDVLRNLRTLFLAFFSINLFIWWLVVQEGGVTRVISDRLSPMGLNPIAIGEWAATLVTLSVAMLFYEKNRWRVVAQIGVGMGTLALIMSGSRTAVGVCMAMLLITVGYQVRNLIIPIASLGLTIIAIFYFMPRLSEQHSVQRLADVNLLDRLEFWKHGLNGFYESPLFGIGWVSTIVNGRLSSQNVHSIYVTVISESGIVGALLMSVMLAYVVVVSVKGYFQIGIKPTLHPMAYRLVGALAAFYFIKGLFESGPVFGTTFMPLIGFYACASLGSPAFRATGQEARLNGG